MKKIKNNWIWLIIGLITSLLCLLCFLYYTRQFFSVILENKELTRWIIFGAFLLFSIIIGIINLIKNNKLQEQNFELKSLVIELIDVSNSNYYSTLEHIQNSREISLDVLNELKEKP